MLNTALAILAVMAVLLVRAVLKLVLLPFRILRGFSDGAPRPQVPGNRGGRDQERESPASS